MSHCVDETYDVYQEREVRARKRGQCDACDEPIAPGHAYWRISIVFDGSASTVRRCARCQAMRKHLRTRGDGDTWPAERLDCGQAYEDEWGDVPDEIAALAFALPGEVTS